MIKINQTLTDKCINAGMKVFSCAITCAIVPPLVLGCWAMYLLSPDEEDEIRE